jgi:uncharacterized secreted protein with C-terminal beta-propeller domain
MLNAYLCYFTVSDLEGERGVSRIKLHLSHSPAVSKRHGTLHSSQYSTLYYYMAIYKIVVAEYVDIYLSLGLDEVGGPTLIVAQK